MSPDASASQPLPPTNATADHGPDADAPPHALRPAAPAFSIEDIPDLSGKVIIVTGGNTGVGKETILALLRKNAKVYMAARSQPKAEAAIAELKTKTGREALFLELDLASLKSIKKAAEEFQSKESQLHILFNNGGVMAPPVEQLTADGYDLQFGTNCLGHFYFTKLLLPTLIETAKSTNDKHVRVITTSSSVHMFHGPGLKWDTLKDSPARRKYNKWLLYGQSKFGNVVVAKELARRYADEGIVSISVNPGNLTTDLHRHVSKAEQWLTQNLLQFPAPFGALTQLWGGTTPETAELNGKYLIPWARLGEPRADTQDPKTGEQLWDWLEEQVKDI
ncbi:NAD-binding protein [Phellopilus nigrolimitatus]|nr:NAD-binding protein [Phellopilus nigrolimitatus]